MKKDVPIFRNLRKIAPSKKSSKPDPLWTTNCIGKLSRKKKKNETVLTTESFNFQVPRDGAAAEVVLKKQKIK